MGFSRRTHIVRIGKAPDPYLDIEVLDAISFRTEQGKAMVLNFSADKVKPYIVDDTGGGNAKNTLNATRRSHMKRITSPTDASQFFDIEVIDAISFRDENNKEWILDLKVVRPYNTTDGVTGSSMGGGSNYTRRVHTEKIYSDQNDETSDHMTVIRCDDMAFRTVRGEELIVKMPSRDDGSTDMDGLGRASTYTTPEDYEPGSTAVVPPANHDPNRYASFPKGSKGALTGKEEVAMGPLWWPRATNTKAGPWWVWTPRFQPVQWSLQFHVGSIGDPYTAIHGFGFGEGLPFLTNYYPPPAVVTWHRLPEIGHAWVDPYPDPFAGQFLPVEGYLSIDDAADAGDIVKFNFKEPPTTRELYAGPYVPTVWQPNAWQLTGFAKEQPYHWDRTDPANPKKVWDEPIASLARKVAKTYEQMWNATSNAYNSGEAANDGYAHDVFVNWWAGTPEASPPYSVSLDPQFLPVTADWAWDVDIVDGPTGAPETIGAQTIQNAGDFYGGLDYSAWFGGHVFVNGGDYGYRMNRFHPAFATPIGVGQLDPKIWDTTGDAPKRRKPPKFGDPPPP